MDPGHLFESVPNFSEGSRPDVIAELASASSRTHVLDIDADVDHNRVVISLAAEGHNVVDALLGAVRVANARIDLREHRGVHPRVGVADVVPIIPLGDTPIAAAHELARTLGERIWEELRLPVYFYGYGEKHTLADIRAGRASPSLGGPQHHPSAGAVCVGARRLLVAFNVLLPGMEAAAARALAKSLRESNGGMRGVQALVFELPRDRIQLSMNLFRLDETPPSAVIAQLEERGVSLGPQQVIGLCPAAVASQPAAGRLLEGRLAAAAARHGAALCAARGDEEHVRLAARLKHEAHELASLNVDQLQLLSGAERATAIGPVLRAAGVLSQEVGSMLDIAARGLLSAVGAETRTMHARRISALDLRQATND